MRPIRCRAGVCGGFGGEGIIRWVPLGSLSLFAVPRIVIRCLRRAAGVRMSCHSFFGGFFFGGGSASCCRCGGLVRCIRFACFRLLRDGLGC